MAATLVMHEIVVHTEHGSPVALVGTRGERAITRILTTWQYRSRWWQHEVMRYYYMLELQGGAIVDVFCENGRWFATKRV